MQGYEIYGMEKIPDKGPVLIVYYHGAIPIDYYYFLASVIIQKGRVCHSVADHFLFKIPGAHMLHILDRYHWGIGLDYLMLVAIHTLKWLSMSVVKPFD